MICYMISRPPRAPLAFEKACVEHLGRRKCDGCGKPLGSAPRYIVQKRKGWQGWLHYHQPCFPIPYDPTRHQEVR